MFSHLVKKLTFKLVLINKHMRFFFGYKEIYNLTVVKENNVYTIFLKKIFLG